MIIANLTSVSFHHSVSEYTCVCVCVGGGARDIANIGQREGDRSGLGWVGQVSAAAFDCK